MGNYSVYKHTNKLTGGVYIGITGRPVEERWKGGSAYKTSHHFYRAIQKYGWDGFEHEVLCSGLSKEEAQEREVELIAHYRTSGCECYNILSGGNLGRSGIPLSPDAREKIRVANLGRVVSREQRKRLSELRRGVRLPPETRKKMSEHNSRYWLGKKRSPETIEKIRQSHIGKTLSHEHRAKISASQPRDYISNCKKKPVLQMDLLGNPIRQWSSMKEAELAIRGCVSGTISACCKGRFQTAFGYKWKLISSEGEYK